MQLKRSGQQLPVLPRAAPQAVDEHVGFVDQREHQRAHLLRETGDERPQGSLARHTQRQRQGPDAAFAILPLRGRGLRPSFDRARELKHGVGIALQEPLPLPVAVALTEPLSVADADPVPHEEAVALPLPVKLEVGDAVEVKLPLPDVVPDAEPVPLALLQPEQPGRRHQQRSPQSRAENWHKFCSNCQKYAKTGIECGMLRTRHPCPHLVLASKRTSSRRKKTAEIHGRCCVTHERVTTKIRTQYRNCN